MPQVLCHWCKQLCYKTPWDLKQYVHVFCSRECRIRWQNRNHKSNATCEWCGTRFFKAPNQLKRSTHHFCSQSCYSQWQRRYRIPRICEICGQSFKLAPSTAHYSAGRFCSPECAGTAVKHIECVCEQCGNIYEVVPSRVPKTRFCSRECQSAWKSAHKYGENNPNWKGGPTKYLGRNWRRQRKRAIRRDKVCRICGAPQSPHNRELSVHHICPVREFADVKRANRLSNLVTLCEPCHKAVENGNMKCPIPQAI